MNLIKPFILLSNFAIIFFLPEVTIGNDNLHIGFNGEILGESEFYPDSNANNPKNELMSGLGGRADISVSGLKDINFRLNMNLNYNFHDKNLSRYQISDAYIDYFSESFELRAGYQIFSWKKVDVGSPVDILNPLDYEVNFISPPKEAIPAIRARIIANLGVEHTFSFYLMPYFQKPFIPNIGNRYYLFTGSPNIILSPDTAIYDSPYKQFRPEGAISYNSALNGFADLGIYYFNGYRRFPVFSSDFNNTGKIQAIERFPTIDLYGLTFEKPILGCMLKTEASFTNFKLPVFSQTQRQITSYTQYAIGVEKTFASIAESQNDLMVNVSLAGDNTPNTQIKYLEGLRFFRSNILAGTRYTFNDASDRIIQIFGNYDYIRNDLIVSVNFEQRIYKSIALGLSSDGPIVSHSEEMKGFKNNLRLSGTIAYRW
jgi:hypothetical protein